MSTIVSPQPTIPTARVRAWFLSRLYRMTLEEYEALALGRHQGRATGSISSTDTWWRR